MVDIMKHPAWLMWSEAIPSEVIDGWVEKCVKLPVEKASTFRSGDDGDDENGGHRKTDIRWVQNDDVYKELHNTIWEYAMTANQHFGVSVSSLPPLQFTEYSDVGHHYDTHHDIDWNRQDGKHRKLSIVIQMSDPDDYEGGELGFKNTTSPHAIDLAKKGSIIVFPSYHEHFVTPITSGHRRSLVAWIEGPRWQ
jgi:PKHD-type hydroxylase